MKVPPQHRTWLTWLLTLTFPLWIIPAGVVFICVGFFVVIYDMVREIVEGEDYTP